jgi:hypothetical protein
MTELQLLANGPDGEGFHHHLNGALDLIKACGVERLQPSIIREIYSTIRSIAVSHEMIPTGIYIYRRYFDAD